MMSIMEMFSDGAQFEKQLVKLFFVTLDRSAELRQKNAY